MKERKPIFYDAEKVRWRRTRRILEVSGGLLTLLLVYFFLTIAGSVELPTSLLPDARPVYRPAKKKILKPVLLREGRHKRVANIGQVPEAYDPLRAAFFVSRNKISLIVRRRKCGNQLILEVSLETTKLTKTFSRLFAALSLRRS